MMGHKNFQPKRLYAFNLEDRVPPDHLLRQVATVVDFSFVRRLTARFYSHTGKPGIDPVVLFKMALIGYLYGITSERRLADELRLNLAFLWFIGYDLDEVPPDHSVLSKARRRFGVTVYQAFFTEIVRQCERAGLIVGQHLYVDSTLVRANADRASVGSRALLEQLATVDAHVAALWRDNPMPEGEGQPDGPSSPRETTGSTPPGEPADELGAAAVMGDGGAPPPPGPHPLGPSDPPNGLQGRTNDLVVSRTDPDAALVGRENVPVALYHKLHVGVDGGTARIITAIDVTPGDTADEALLDRIRKEHEGTTGRKVAEVTADAKYGTHEIYKMLEGAGIRPSIPPHRASDQQRAVPREQFVYDPVTDRFTCPQGHPLTRQGTSHTANSAGSIIYRASPKACGACPLQAACCGTAQARTISRPNDEGLADRVRTYLRTPHAKHSRRRRLSWAETPIAELKERHGVRRAQRRGRDNVLIQALGAASAYDIKKLVRWHRRCPETIALACHDPASAPCATWSSRPQPHDCAPGRTFISALHPCPFRYAPGWWPTALPLDPPASRPSLTGQPLTTELGNRPRGKI
jgi:transposase